MAVRTSYKGENMKQRAFEIGVAIMMFGATAMDSEGVGWIIAAGMVIAGAVIAHVAYTLERVEKERKETERRIQQLRKASWKEKNAHQWNKAYVSAISE